MEKIILWGGGKVAGDFCTALQRDMDSCYEILGIIDKNPDKWGNHIGTYPIVSPEKGLMFHYDKIIITSINFYEEIKRELLDRYHIDKAHIENMYFLGKKKILARYGGSDDPEIRQICDFLRDNEAGVFNYAYTLKYREEDIKVGYDEEVHLYYVTNAGKRIYMARHLDTPQKVANYYNGLLIEQDLESPHRYLTDDFDVKKGDVVVDVGAAEGNFAIDVIDRASKVYLVESDDAWIDALKCTFRDYTDKVVFINKYAADFSYAGTIKLDDCIEENVDFIKADAEGCEAVVLRGLADTVKRSDDIKLVFCTYHQENDAEVLRGMLTNEFGMKCAYSKGYMYYPTTVIQRFICPSLRRGLIRAKREVHILEDIS